MNRKNKSLSSIPAGFLMSLALLSFPGSSTPVMAGQNAADQGAAGQNMTRQSITEKSHAQNPAQMLHKLQLAQERLAGGDVAALPEQARILSELGARFAQADPEIFKEKHNFYTVLIYLFNGGNPEYVQAILENAPDDLVDKRLIEGALAYSSGRELDFHAALGGAETDDADWPQTLRASIYLALIPYLARKNPDIADARLDYVRLVAPGSLFEEAALRRQVRIAAVLGNRDKIFLLVRHYATRFSTSPYMRDFWAEVMETLTSSKLAWPENEIDRLLTYMPEKLRYATYLKLARLALLDARLEQVTTYAHTAQELAHSLNLNKKQALFYQLAAQAGTQQAEKVGQLLQEIIPEDLPERDRALLVAARNVAQAVTLQPTYVENTIQDTHASNAGQNTHISDDLPKPDEFLQQTKAILDQIDTLLNERK